MELAAEVHRIIELQYREIKHYLELITAQTDLESRADQLFQCSVWPAQQQNRCAKADGAILLK